MKAGRRPSTRAPGKRSAGADRAGSRAGSRSASRPSARAGSRAGNRTNDRIGDRAVPAQASVPTPAAPERVQKFLARLGHGSRREIEEWIRAARIQINGRTAVLGDTVTAEDQLTVDGRRVLAAAGTPACRVLLYNKPEGEICTRADPEGRPSIFERLPASGGQRWVSVGRLDVNTSGLLLLTTDGELANRLMHPSGGIEREYLIRVLGEVTPEMLERLRSGVELEDGPASFARVYEVGGRGSNRWYGAVLLEGRKREVRRLWEALGLRVSRLKRIRFGPISLPSHLRRGQFMELDDAAIATLRAALPSPAAARR